jgi:abnormal spindle-like microcephaly-associated protein
VQIVSDFLQSRLVGEGNVLRHLELLGYRLGYSQSALMEYPFAITNLAVDLRDGLRLIKVAEVLTGVPSCCYAQECAMHRQ